MFPESEIDGFRKYWRRRKPGSSTAIHYSSDVRIFFRWAEGYSPDAVTVHDVDRFIVWQQSLGHAPTTITRRLIALRMFYDYLAYARDQALANPVVPHRHYVARGQRLPRNLTEEAIQRLFAAIGEHPRDRALFTLMLHGGLRVGEVAGLEVSQVAVRMGSTPQLRVTGKGQRERLVYLSATAAHYLRDLRSGAASGRRERAGVLESSRSANYHHRRSMAIGRLLSSGRHLADLSPAAPHPSAPLRTSSLPVA